MAEGEKENNVKEIHKSMKREGCLQSHIGGESHFDLPAQSFKRFRSVDFFPLTVTSWTCWMAGTSFIGKRLGNRVDFEKGNSSCPIL